MTFPFYDKGQQKNESVALVWHSNRMAQYLVEKYGWHLIEDQAIFDQTKFSRFSEIIILAELNWGGSKTSQMIGLKLIQQILQVIDLKETRIRLVSYYSHQFLQRCMPKTYRLSQLFFNSPTHTVELDMISIWSKTNLSDYVAEDLLRNLYYAIDHDTKISDLIVRTKTELNQLYQLSLNASLEGLELHCGQNKLFPLVRKLHYNYTELIKFDDNAYIKMMIEEFQFSSVIKLIDGLEFHWDRVSHCNCLDRPVRRSIRHLYSGLDKLSYHVQRMEKILRDYSS